jgi:hypothetical protein
LHRRILELEEEDVGERWRKMHHEQLHNLYPSPNIIITIKSRRMRLEYQVAFMEK